MPYTRLLDRVAHRLPSLCAVCHGWGAGRLCVPCLRRYTSQVERCDRCALEVPAGQPTCGACLTAPPAFTRTLTALEYAHPWDGLIARFKFRGALDLAPALARRMLEAAEGAGAPSPELLLPIPLAAARLRERGYNQAWELVRRLRRALGCRAEAQLLRRVKETSPQLTLPLAQRAANVRTAFSVAPGRSGELRGRVVTLVDDVMTTGASAGEAARELLRAGAAEVHVWVLARTPRPGER